MKKALSLTLLLALSACSSTPPPAWQVDTRQAIDGFTADYLLGHTVAANAQFRDARNSATATGRFEAVIQLELVRCAAQVASLEFDDCPGYAALALDASNAQRAYADFLAGRWQTLDVNALPAQHRTVVSAAALDNIKDPLARLVAAGALLRTARITPQQIQTALDTASTQGWRRPLLAWLGVQAKRAEAAGDSQALAHYQRRIALASEKP